MESNTVKEFSKFINIYIQSTELIALVLMDKKRKESGKMEKESNGKMKTDGLIFNKSS